MLFPMVPLWAFPALSPIFASGFSLCQRVQPLSAGPHIATGPTLRCGGTAYLVEALGPVAKVGPVAKFGPADKG